MFIIRLCRSPRSLKSQLQNFTFGSHVFFFFHIFVCHIYVNKWWNISGRNFRFNTHVHVCTMDIHINNFDNSLSIFNWVVIFSFIHIYVNNSWTTCIRNFKLYTNEHLYISNMDNIPSIFLWYPYLFICVRKFKFYTLEFTWPSYAHQYIWQYLRFPHWQTYWSLYHIYVNDTLNMLLSFPNITHMYICLPLKSQLMIFRIY